MKSRRRARRVALQALYELDQSTHSIDSVLEARTAELFRAAVEGSIAPGDKPVATYLLELEPTNGPDELDPNQAAIELGVEPSRVVEVVAVLEGVWSQAEYGDRIVRGVWRNRVALDEVISEIAPEWPVSQMAPIDRCLLRIALWEIASGSAPVRVVINEAVELARQFSGEGARRMVNGALGAYTSRSIALELDEDEF